MKKICNNYLCFCVFIILIISFKYILDENILYYFILSFSTYIILISSVSHINIEKRIFELKEKNYENSRVKLFYLSICGILFINFVYFCIMYFLNFILNKSIYFEKYNYISLAMVSVIWIIPVIRIIKQYLKAIGNKKLANLIQYTFYNIYVINIIILLLIYKFIKTDNIFLVTNFYLSQFVSLIFVIIILFILNKKEKFFELKKLKKRKENYVNIFTDLKQIFQNNIYFSIKKIVSIGYYYFSIIVVYIIILYKYSYSYDQTIKLVTDTYFYFTLLVLVLCKLFLEKCKDNIEVIKHNIKEKKCKNFEISNLFINIIKKIIPVTLLLCVLSGPLLNLLFDSNESTIFMLLIWIMPFIILYEVGITLLETIFYKKKIVYMILFLGIFIKIIFTIPLIDSFYRMGYTLIYGDIIATIIGLFIPFIITIIYLNKRFSINFTNSLEKILNIIYENIILCLLLVISSMVFSLNTKTKLESLVIIIIYVIIFILYLILKKILKMFGGKNEK